MLKERLNEVFEFTKSESPYKKANKGWINKDIFLDLSPSTDIAKQTNEDAKVTLFWSPINSLLSNIFIVIIIGSILVFTSVSVSKGRFDFNLFNNSLIIDSIKYQENNPLNIIELENKNSSNQPPQQNIATKDQGESTKINSLYDDLKKDNEKIINKKIDKEETSIIDNQSHKDIKNLQNKKLKSNFI